MDEPAIACSLGPRDYERRLFEIRRLGELALLDIAATPGGARLSFRDADGVRNQLQSIVEAEAACCSFLDLTLGSETGRLTLDISAQPDAMPVVRDFLASFQAGTT
jgi:hypothetical protein